jgi:hypothetical protein
MNRLVNLAGWQQLGPGKEHQHIGDPQGIESAFQQERTINATGEGQGHPAASLQNGSELFGLGFK